MFTGSNLNCLKIQFQVIYEKQFYTEIQLLYIWI